MRDGFDDVNETALPFIVNVVKVGDSAADTGPVYNNNWHCPMPVRHDLTLREYLAIKCDLKTFSGNANLYKHHLK